MSFTPFNAPLLGGLFGDREAASFFSVESDLNAVRRFEIALANAQAKAGFISAKTAAAIKDRLADFQPDMAALAEAVQTDGVAIPALITQMREHIGAPHAENLHSGTTSQDVVDTSLMLRLEELFGIYEKRISKIVEALDRLAEAHGGVKVMARTRFQQAVSISLAHKISMWRDPLIRLSAERPGPLPVQIGGPEGALSGMGEAPEEIVKAVSEELKLSAPPVHWQTDRWPIVEAATWVVRLANAIGKIGFDVTLMAQNEIAEVKIKGGGASSSMPHKNNPILAESLVSIARFCATQMDGLHQAALHENERSGMSWSLEWLLLPPLMVASGASLRNVQKLLEQLDFSTG